MNMRQHTVTQYAGFIAGRLVEGRGELLRVVNPSDGNDVTQLHSLDIEQVTQAIQAAHGAFDSGEWSQLPATERARYLRALVQSLADRTDAIIDTVVAEAGCPRASSVMHAQVRTPLRHAIEAIELFLSLPEVEENPLPLAERVSPGDR
jgi:aldehyde dehydrogenase (NAD+)